MWSDHVKRLGCVVLSLAFLACGAQGPESGAPASTEAAATTYQATWASVDQHNPAPEWFKDAKFGIYFHWGVYSVPAYGSEWYPRNMYHSGSGEYNHHLSVFGDPYSNWPYHNFINGANDKSGHFTQFAPKLVSQGGSWDPSAWAQLFVDAGAKFAGPVAEHHDGFSQWNSSVNEWNSVNKGPKLDLVGQLATAIRAKGLKLFVSSHNAYNFTGYYQWVPAQSDPSLQKLYGQLPSATEYQLWVDKLKELIDKYQPDIIYHDFNLAQIPESYRLQFLAYYYNAAIDQGKEVLTTYKDGFNQNGELLDYERGGPGGLTSYYWLTDDAISSSTWCYTTGMQYYSTVALLHAMIDRVSKNGNMVLNISPMADGTIPAQQQTILRGMGDWLKNFGEAIYSTRAWTTYGEGPTKMGGGSFVTPIAGTAQDIRYTRSKDNTVLYAIVLGWPGNGGTVKLTSLAAGKLDVSTVKSVQLITAPNTYATLSYRQDSTALNVSMPATQPVTALAYVVKLTFASQLPSRVTFFQDTNYGGTSVALGAGTYTTAQLSAAGIPDNWVSSIRVPAGYTVDIFDSDNLGGTKWTFTADNADFIAAGCNDRMSSVRITAPNTATYALTVGKAGAGSGTVAGGAISCGTTCSATYSSGTSVTLTATATAPSTFGGWSGACSGTSATCTVTMTQAQTVTATFNGGSAGGPISINAGGTASGTFVADVDFSGGSTYSTTTAIDTSQVPAPAPAQAVLQTERYGAFTYTIPGLTPGGPYSVTLYFAESYWTAAGQRAFNVAINGTSVLSAFDIFAAAGGANKAIARTFDTTANASGQVAIAFTAGTADNPKVDGITVAAGGTTPPPTYTLSVTKAGTGAGTVTGGGISCGSTCSAANLASGTTVTLTATPASGSTFAGWSGACTGTGTCAVTMTANQTATATFNTSGGTGTCTTATGGQSGNFNTTGAVCYTVSGTINGWGCSNADGRTVTVNGAAVTCGQMPLPGSSPYTFSFSAGTYPWASFYWW